MMVTANFLYIKFSLPFSSYFLCFQNFQKSMLFLFCLSYFYEIIRMIKSAHKTRPVRYDTHFLKLNGVCSFQTCDWFWKMNCVLNYAIANIFSAFSALILIHQHNVNKNHGMKTLQVYKNNLLFKDC
jgi:hypothetical protein